MSLAMSAAPVNFSNNNENINNNNNRAQTSRNKTIKCREQTKVSPPPKKITRDLVPSINTDSEDESLADFNPQNLSSPVQPQVPLKQNMDQNNSNSNSTPQDPSIQPEAFSQLESTYSKDYYKQYRYPGSYVASQPSIDSQAELLKKLDNILYLLEEQHEDKTNLITEELILYVFLGIFVIYVLDSFVRVGKYVR